MKPEDAETRFRAFLSERGTRFEAVEALDGLTAMLDFYREIRADGLGFEEDEDMLLFQWGCYQENEGIAFLFDITRQLIFAEPEEGSIWQLHLSFYFDPTDDLRKLGNGDEWCHSLEMLPSFAGLLADHPVVLAVANHRPRRKRLRYGDV